MIILFLIGILAFILEVGFVCSQGNTSTTQIPAVLSFSDKEKQSFPAWLVGVIVLSSLVVIIAVITIVQRIIRRRANNNEQYRMTS